MSKARGFCFTLNNYTEDDETEALGLWWPDGVQYVVVGKEVGKCGTPHLQGFIRFHSPRTLNSMMNSFFSGRAHWEGQRGTCTQAATYCKKDGDFFEWGDCPKDQAQKGDAERERWELARALAREGKFLEIPTDIYVRNMSAWQRIYLQEGLKPDVLEGDLEHEWWYGEPGTGKTRKVWEDYPSCYIKDPKERWWDGYQGEEVVVIDDFDKFQLSMGGDMKRWLDRYPYQAPFKGGYQMIRPKKIIVTSNYHPDQIWDDEITRKAIGRRVKIVRFGEEPQYPCFVNTFNRNP